MKFGRTEFNLHPPQTKSWDRQQRCSEQEIHTNCLFESAGKQKQVRATSRKSKSPNLGQAYAGGERPSSVSSVHSEGDYHRPTQPQWSWDDRPSSTGESSYLIPLQVYHFSFLRDVQCDGCTWSDHSSAINCFVSGETHDRESHGTFLHYVGLTSVTWSRAFGSSQKKHGKQNSAQ